jgi:LysR family transcriptional regulator, nitrogen assimilation regulatory protein
MNLRQIEYFIDIVEKGSLSRAALHLRIAQSALSRQMNLLEDELGVAVLDRHGRGVRLTEAGQLLYERARLVLRDVSHLREDLIARATTPVGALNIGIPTSFRALLTRPAVEHFLAAWPAVRLKVFEDTSAVIRDYLLSGEIDIGLLSDGEVSPVMEATSLLSEAMYLIGPPDADLAPRRPVAIAKVAAVPLIMTSRPSILRLAVERMFDQHGLAGTFVIDINSTLIFDMVSAGHGYTVFPYCGAHALLRDGCATAAPIKGFRMSWSLVTLRERPASLATRLFHDLLLKTAREAVEAGTWRSGIALGLHH